MIESVLSRRAFVFAAGGAVASVGLLSLAGCGGHRSHGSQSGGTAIEGTSGKVTISLPAGVSGASLVCATGWGSVTGLTKPVTVPYMKNNVTLALVLDPSSGKVVMAGMIDAAASGHTIDAANVAGALIFLKMGGVQTPFAIRPELWALVLADPATASLVPVVQARLAANPYAIDDQDPQLLSALQSAVSSLSSVTLAGLSLGGGTKARAKVKSRADGSGTSTIDPPVPAEGIDLGTETDDERRINPLFADILIGVNREPREALNYLYDAAQTDASGTANVFDTVRFLSGPTSLAARILPDANGSHETFTVPLAHAADLSRHVIAIRLTPVFDSTVDDFTASGPSTVYAPFLDTWRAALTPMYERVAVQVALFAFLEALGRGGVQLSAEQIVATVPRLSAVSAALAGAITQAGEGRDLIASANRIITAAIADASSIAGLLGVLHDLFQIRVNDINVSLLRSTYPLSSWVDILGAPGSDYIRSCTHRAFDRTFDTRQFTSVYVDSLSISKIVYTVVPATSGYSVGGSSVALSLRDSANESFDSSVQAYRKYHWKLSGAGNGTLNDGAGKSGQDITTTSSNVAFVPGSTTEGDQVVTVGVISLESSNAVTTATATLTLSPTLFQLLPNAPTVDLGAQKLFELQRNDGASFPSGSTFRWTLTGTGSLAGGSPVTTSSPTITYTAPNLPGQDTLTVEAFDGAGKSQGKVATTITMSTPSRITPFNPYVRHNGTQTFTVAPLTGGYPSGATFTWTLTGAGSIGGSNTVKTSTASIVYTAPSSDASPSLSVVVADSSGKTIAKTTTNITVTNSQIIIPTVQWFNTGTYSGPEAGYTSEEIQGLVVFAPVAGATKYEMHVDDPSLIHPSTPLTAAQFAAGAPNWDPTIPLYQNPDPSIYPVPYGGRHVAYPVEYDVFYNAAGGIAWPVEGGQFSSPAASFPEAFAKYFQSQKDANAARTYRVVVSF